MTLKRQLVVLGACKDAIVWATGYSALEKAWAACDRGDWMLWLVSQTLGKEYSSDGRKRLVFAACQCARLSLPYTSDARVLAAIETTERWTKGLVDIQEVRDAANAAYAAYAADAAYAAYAANAANAAYAANAANAANAAYAAFAAYAANAANAAYAANAANAAYAVTFITRSQCADIIRPLFLASELKG